MFRKGIDLFMDKTLEISAQSRPCSNTRMCEGMERGPVNVQGWEVFDSPMPGGGAEASVAGSMVQPIGFFVATVSELVDLAIKTLGRWRSLDSMRGSRGSSLRVLSA